MRWLCKLGVHGAFVVAGGQTPAGSRRWCGYCDATWRGTYDGIEAGWERIPSSIEVHRNAEQKRLCACNQPGAYCHCGGKRP